MTEQKKLKIASERLEKKHYEEQGKFTASVLILASLVMLMIIAFGVVIVFVPDAGMWSMTFACLAFIPLVIIMKKDKSKPNFSIYEEWEQSAVNYIESCGVEVKSMDPAFKKNRVHTAIAGRYLHGALQSSIYKGKGKVEGVYTDLELKGMSNKDIILFGAGKELKSKES